MQKSHLGEDDLNGCIRCMMEERWSAQVKELLLALHGHQKKTLAFFVTGIVLAESTVLQRVAESISLQGINFHR